MSWLSGWAKRIEITLSDTYFDSNQTDFPHLVYLSASSGPGADDASAVFDELGSDANRKKIAVTLSDGTTQCYVEIEKWDHANEKAWLWVKVPSILATGGATIYLYYDSTKSDNTSYIGDVTDTPAQNVWDSNFALVWHMGQDPSGGSECILDSTSNGNNGTPAGNMTLGDLVDGKIGKCLEFDGVDDEINLKSMISDSTMTIEILYYCPDYGAWTMFCGKDGATTDFFGYYTTSNLIRVRADNTDADVTETLDINSWINLAASLDGSNATIMENGVNKGTPALNSKVFDLDTLGYGFTVSNYHFMGKICEFRVSDIDRGADWLKAVHHSINDNINSFGSEENCAYLEDASLNLSTYGSSLENLQAFLRAHDGVETRDLQAILEAFNLSTDDFSTLLMTVMEATADLAGDFETWATQYKDLSAGFDLKGQSIESLMSRFETAKAKYKNLAAFLSVTDGSVLKDLAAFFSVTDGSTLTNMGLHLKAIQSVPAFRSITAQRVSSVVHEVS